MTSQLSGSNGMALFATFAQGRPGAGSSLDQRVWWFRAPVEEVLRNSPKGGPYRAAFKTCASWTIRAETTSCRRSGRCATLWRCELQTAITAGVV